MTTSGKKTQTTFFSERRDVGPQLLSSQFLCWWFNFFTENSLLALIGKNSVIQLQLEPVKKWQICFPLVHWNCRLGTNFYIEWFDFSSFWYFRRTLFTIKWPYFILMHRIVRSNSCDSDHPQGFLFCLPGLFLEKSFTAVFHCTGLWHHSQRVQQLRAPFHDLWKYSLAAASFTLPKLRSMFRALIWEQEKVVSPGGRQLLGKN